MQSRQIRSLAHLSEMAPVSNITADHQSVAEAVEHRQKLFDLYILDFKLEDGCGLDIAERVRSKGSEAPFILAPKRQAWTLPHR